MGELSTDQLARLNFLMQELFQKRDVSVIDEVFTLFDRNGNGEIEVSELRTVMSQAPGGGGGITLEDAVNRFIQEADTNKNGTVDLTEFIEFLKKQL